ncbi:MAG TPA: preprotein translocase subunit YajC [Gammaproteobacteria bacterium]
MSFFISEAWAEAAPAAQAQGPLMGFLPLILIFVVFYFMLIRPQAKRAKEHKRMVEALAKGDEVLTSGGLLGKVTELGENFVEVELADNVRVKVQRQAISSVMPKGTLNSL